MSRAKAIRKKCLDCCVYQPKLVRLCPATDCPLWQFRLGRKMPKKEVFLEGKPEKGIMDAEKISEEKYY